MQLFPPPKSIRPPSSPNPPPSSVKTPSSAKLSQNIASQNVPSSQPSTSTPSQVRRNDALHSVSFPSYPSHTKQPPQLPPAPSRKDIDSSPELNRLPDSARSRHSVTSPFNSELNSPDEILEHAEAILTEKDWRRESLEGKSSQEEEKSEFMGVHHPHREVAQENSDSQVFFCLFKP